MAADEEHVTTYEELMARKEMDLKIRGIIRREADEILKEHRFRYDELQRDHTGMTRYTRNKGKDWQSIIFSATTDSLHIRLQTKYTGEPQIRHFVPGVTCWWSFGSLEEFEQLCPEVVDAVKRYVFRIYDMMPRERKWPKIEMLSDTSKALYEDPEGLAADFKRLYGFPDDIFYADIRRMEAMLAERTDQSFGEVQEFILQVTAYLGESLIKRFGGTWMLQKSGYLCFVGFGDPDTAYEENRYYNILPKVIGAWDSPNASYSNLYMSFLDAGKKSGTVPESWLNPFW